MKRLISICLAVVFAVILAGASVLAEDGEPISDGAVRFATVGDARDAYGYTGFEGAYGNVYSVIIEADGHYYRAVADLDEKSAELNSAYLDAAYTVDLDAVMAAKEAYDAYVRTLSVHTVEEITAVPEDPESLAGKTLGDLEEQGFEIISYEEASGKALLTMEYGMYTYAVVTVESYDEFEAAEDEYGGLTVQGVTVTGPSNNTLNPDYLADGTCIGTGEGDLFGEPLNFINDIYEAVQKGELDLDTMISDLTESLEDADSEEAEMIRSTLEMLKNLVPAGE